MSDDNKDLVKEIEIHQYFEDAIDWYCIRYLSCITERAWLLLITLFLSTICMIAIVNIYSLFPTKHDFTLIKYTDRYTDEFSIIKKLSTNIEENEQISISRYLVSEYVRRYESYDYSDLSNQFNFIKNNSSRRVFLGFKEIMDPDSISSPIVKYKSDTKRIVSIHSVNLSLNSSSFLSNATITFRAQNITRGAKSSDIEEHKVLISFSLSSIKMNAAGIMPLEFSVSNYQYLR